MQDIFFHLYHKTDEQGRIDIHELTFDETRKYVQEINDENTECKNEIIEKGIENKNIEIGKGTEHINDEMQKNPWNMEMVKTRSTVSRTTQKMVTRFSVLKKNAQKISSLLYTEHQMAYRQ